LLDVLAPGGVSGSKITSLAVGGGVTDKFGTSMATPHVAGAAALLLEFGRRELGRNLTPTEILNTLTSTGANLTDSGSGLVFPRIDVLAAVNSLDNVSPSAEYVNPTPANNSKVGSQLTVMINVSERLQSVLLNFNGTIYNMSLNSTDVLYAQSLSGLVNANYTISVNGTDHGGNNFVLGELTITANNSAPIINTITPNSSQVNTSENQNVLFNQSSSDVDNDTLTYFWFVDGVVQNQNSSFNYTPGFDDAGLRNVTLVVSDGFLNTSNYWNVSVANTNGPPIVSIIQPSNNTILKVETITNFSSNITDPDGDNISVVWSFGDGNTSTSLNTTHVYGANGNYTIILNATDGNLTANYSIRVEVLPNLAPVGSITAPTNASTHKLGASILFTTNATDPDGDNLTIIWDFGDTNSSNSTNTTHSYNATGNYTVILNVSDGNTTVNDTITLNITDTTAPSILSTSPTNASSLSSGTTSTTIELTTDEIAVCRYNTSDVAWANMTQVNNTNSTLHNLSVTGLSNGNTFNYYFLCEDDESTPNRMNTSYGLQFSISSPSTSNDDSSSSSSPSSGGGGGGVASTISTTTTDAKVTAAWTSVYGNAQAGQTYQMDLKQSADIPFNSITFTPSLTIPTLTLSVFRFDDNPTKNELDNVFAFLEISTEGATGDSFSSTNFEFFITKSWLESNNLDSEKVSLQRFSSDTWTKLPTTKKVELEDRFIYSATSPGFSFFSIQADKIVTTADPQPASEIPVQNGVEPVPVEVESPQVIGSVIGLEESKKMSFLKERGVNIVIAAFIFFIIIILLQHFSRPYEGEPNKKKSSVKLKSKTSRKQSMSQKAEQPTKPGSYYRKYFNFYSKYYDKIAQRRSSSSKRVSSNDIEKSSKGTTRKNS